MTNITREQLEAMIAECEDGQDPFATGEVDAIAILSLALRGVAIDTPETEDFMKAVPMEAAHQINRWGEDHDKNKTPWDWYWVLGYLGGKAANNMMHGNTEKAKHHCITLAALALNWHKRLSSLPTGGE